MSTIPPWLMVSLILLVGMLAAAPGTLALMRRSQQNSNGEAGRYLRQLMDCEDERARDKSEIRRLSERVAALESQTAQQENEIAALRRTIVEMAQDHSNAHTVRRRPGQPPAAPLQRSELLRQELEAAKINLARLDLERTKGGPDVYRDNQIADTERRIKAIERELDNGG